MTDQDWIKEASGGLQSDFGVPARLADYVAGKLLEREKAHGEPGDPLSVVSLHMGSDEPPFDLQPFLKVRQE